MAKETNPEERREEARRAMEGEEWRRKREEQKGLLSKRRLEAQRAMESREQKLKRELKERARAAAAQAAAKTKQEQIKRQEQQAAAREIEKGRETVVAEAARTRRQKIETSGRTIERMKAAPTNINALRTLKTDLARAASTGTSMTSVLMNEEARRAGQVNNRRTARTGHFLSVLTVLLVIGGVGLLAYIYFFQYRPTTISVTPPPIDSGSANRQKNFILIDEEINLDASQITDTQLGREKLVASIRQAINDGEIKPDRLTRLNFASTTPALVFKAWLELLDQAPPETLAPWLKPEFIFGRYDKPRDSSAFLIFRINDYDQSLPGLRQWEKKLSALFYLLTGHATLAPRVDGITLSFQTQLNRNLETRVWPRALDTEEVALLYVFLDPTTIAVVENEDAFNEILTRYLN